MKRLALNKESVRNLDERVMEKIQGGVALDSTTRGKPCQKLTKCPNIAC